MTDAEINEEMERIRFYLHAYIDVCFARPEQRWFMPSRKDFERNFNRNKPMFCRTIRIHNDRSWSYHPCIGPVEDTGSTSIASRYHFSIYGVEFGHGPWIIHRSQAPYNNATA